MAPLREYLCKYCDHQFDEFVTSMDPDDYKQHKCRCGSKAELLPSLIGGVNGTPLSGARPKNSGAMKSKKAFTGHPGNDGEPENKQIEFDFQSWPKEKEYD